MTEFLCNGVITAASLIMILVFAAFILTGQEAIMQIGLGFAAAIFVDAYIIRTVLVPAVMHMLGRANWWLPGWLDRTLPRLHVEPAELTRALASRPPSGSRAIGRAGHRPDRGERPTPGRAGQPLTRSTRLV